MNRNPVNLFVRFLLEIAMLIVLAYWGWHLKGDWERWAGAIGLPLAAAALWGIFRIPDDPKPAPVEVPGIVRLLLEWMLFGLAVWALCDLKHLIVIHNLHCTFHKYEACIESYGSTLLFLLNTKHNTCL